MIDRNCYSTPLASRYASKDMSRIFSDQFRYSTWRRVWLALAEAEAELGLPITEEQLAKLRATLNDIDFDAVANYEHKLRHDVMAHLHGWADILGDAGGILHLGATSCFVTDNADAIMLREAIRVLLARISGVLNALKTFAIEYRDMPCLAFTHGQSAQPTTVGKRATLWMQDLVLDIAELERLERELPCRSVKGTTGTQASFMSLFDNNQEKIRELELLVAKKLGFDNIVPVTGQTYPRKIDSQILSVVAGAAQSGSKFGHDIRLLQARHEIEEPFGKNQVGSSAMVYKRNPMRSERICSLARHVATLATEGVWTASVQWFERTLDDSAARRMYMPEAFLATDAILVIYENVASGLVVRPRVIEANLSSELPFMASEAILMEASRAGGDRQELHELLRVHSQEAAKVMLDEGKPNDFLDRVAADPAFSGVASKLDDIMRPELFIGRAPAQIDEFLEDVIAPILERIKPSRDDALV